MRMLKKWAKRCCYFAIFILLGVVVTRIYDIQRKPDLERWHTFVPQEMQAHEIDNATWNDYINTENRIFEAVRHNVTDKLEPSQRTALNRYYAESPVYPDHFSLNWNRSFILKPQGQPKGAVVLLHGLTDGPYSLRTIALNYQQQGYVAVGIRLPAHGTVPGALTEVEWQDWLAATRLAVREARGLTQKNLPLHIVGFSNGGALALKYALDALDNPALDKPQRLILISPMIGITSFARFTGIAGWPAIFPAFAKAAWLDIIPEFNPFKYNSFPVNAARQSYALTQALQKQIQADSQNHKLGALPPILTFQSVVDSTVSSRAVIDALYDKLPANGSEVVLFDLNQAATVTPLIRASAASALPKMVPPAPRNYSVTIVSNITSDTTKTQASTVAAQETWESVEPLGIDYPADLFSLSHIALPFPINDPLYGRYPEPRNQYGIGLGTFSARGERGVLTVNLDTLMRVTWNPFYPYMIHRIDQKISSE